MQQEQDRADAIHARNNEEMERARVWDGMDTLSKARVHLRRAVGSLTEAATHVDDRIEEGGVQGTLYREAIAAGMRAGVQTIINRAEIQQQNNPFFHLGEDSIKEKPTLFFSPENYPQKQEPSTETQNESDSNSTIPAFYGSEPESKPEPEKKPPLVKAQPLNQDFLDQLDKYHTDLKKPEEDEKGEKKDNQF